MQYILNAVVKNLLPMVLMLLAATEHAQLLKFVQRPVSLKVGPLWLILAILKFRIYQSKDNHANKSEKQY